MKGKFLIEQYACLAAGFLLLNKQSDSQVVYTDVEPDWIFQDDGDFSYLDMNDDGINDFGFLKSNHIISTLSSPGLNTTWYYRIALWVGPAMVGPDIAGISAHASSAAGTYCFPYALEKSNLINNDLSFQNCGFQLLASKTAEVYYGYSYTFLGLGDWHIGIGEFNNLNLDSTRYIGVRFEDEDDCLHYGWIRCAVMDSVGKLVVMDYAYEMQCNKTIAAGDTVSYVDINSETTDSGISIYAFDGKIYFHGNSAGKMVITVSDITGQIVAHQCISGNDKTINMNFEPKGIYVVNVVCNGKYFNKKVVID